jgi:hypothetical protein
MQIYKSDDHRFGFEITPVFYYYYIFQGSLADQNPDNLYGINDNFFNFGIEASAGYFITPALYAGISFFYAYYNQFNKYTAMDTINGILYDFTYWNESYYYADLRYYFIRNIALEAGLKNNDFLIGIDCYNFYIGYDINQNQIILNYGTRF